MRSPFPHRRRVLAFTLVELLVVLGIIALLAGLLYPNFSQYIQKAQSLKCANNLRAIGIAVNLAATDNNNTYPEINQTAPPLPYDSSVPGLVGVLESYGISINSVQCPVDMLSGATSAYTKYGSSYEWNPVFDDEVTGDPVIFPNPTTPITVNNTHVRLCTDFGSIHKARMNALYGDGHVTIH